VLVLEGKNWRAPFDGFTTRDEVVNEAPTRVAWKGLADLNRQVSMAAQPQSQWLVKEVLTLAVLELVEVAASTSAGLRACFACVGEAVYFPTLRCVRSQQRPSASL
jgi:predicted P-loop ATPase/GTPase